MERATKPKRPPLRTSSGHSSTSGPNATHTLPKKISKGSLSRSLGASGDGQNDDQTVSNGSKVKATDTTDVLVG